MEIEKLQFEVRPRRHFEALDMGFLLVRKWWIPMLLYWLEWSLPVFLALTVLFDGVVVSLIVVWWLQPLFERKPLIYLSLAVFGEAPTYSSVRQATSAHGLLRLVSVRRFSLMRSFFAPVFALESPESSWRSSRFDELRLEVGRVATGLTAFAFVLQFVLWLGLLLVMEAFVPSEFGSLLPIFGDGETQGEWLKYVVGAAAFVALAVIAPFYVAAGFTLYLNRRIELEGWDIELGFKRLIARVAPVLLISVAFGVCLPALADEATPLDASASESQRLIEEVLSDEDFNTYRTKWSIQLDRDEFEPPGTIWGLGSLLSFLENVFVILLWIGLALLAAWIVHRIIVTKAWKWFDVNRKVSTAAPVQFVAPASDGLPSDVTALAEQAWERKDYRQAVSLLYRGAVRALSAKYGCRVDSSCTEGECMAASKTSTRQTAQSFAEITRAWQQIAYRRVHPSDSEFLNTLRQYERDFV